MHCTKRWFLLLACSMGIFVSVPFARRPVNFLYAHNLMRLTLGMISLSVLGLLYWALCRRLQFRLRNFLLVLLPFGTIYCVYFFNLDNLSERIHIPEYGLLAVLGLYCLAPTVHNHWKRYFLALCIASAIGGVDELIQKITPERYCEWRDIGINITSALVGLALVRWVEYLHGPLARTPMVE